MVAVGAVILDQTSKGIVRSLLEPGRRIDIVPGLFSLKLTENPGAAFGALGSWPPLLILISLAAVVAIIALRKEREKSRILAVSLGLLLGGAMGNLIDRIFFRYVTDFLDIGVTIGGRFLSWPTFNLADVSITLGVILLVYYMFRAERKQAGEEKAASVRNKY